MVKKILYVINESYFFLSHKKELADKVKESGYEVHVAVPKDNVWAPENFSNQKISERGFVCHEYDLSRRGENIFLEFKSFCQIFLIIIKVKPSILHFMTIKPIIYGGLISIFFSRALKVFSITGLGQVFTENTLYAKFRRLIVIFFFKLIFSSKSSNLIVQNSYDFDLIFKRNLIDKKRLHLIKSSGVNLKEFPYIKEIKETVPVVTLASRLLWEKGIKQFVEAARLLKQKNLNIRFILVGDTKDSNPRSVPRSVIESWVNEGLVDWLGRKENMSDIFAKSNIVCLPTVYGEGVPKVILESAATGRVLVVSDNPGCKELVIDRVTGLVVKDGNPNQLASSINELINDDTLREYLASNAMKKIFKEFSSEIVVNKTTEIYKIKKITV